MKKHSILLLFYLAISSCNSDTSSPAAIEDLSYKSQTPIEISIPAYIKNAVSALHEKYPELNELIDLSLFIDNSMHNAPLEKIEATTRQLINILTHSELKTIDPNDTTIPLLQAYLHDIESGILHPSRSSRAARPEPEAVADAYQEIEENDPDAQYARKRSPANTEYGVLYTNVVAGTMVAANSGGLGSDGQLLIASSSTGPIFAPLTSTGGTITFTSGSNSLDLEVAGATQFPTNAGTATPSATGALTIAGGSNINTSGAGSTVTVNLNNSPSVSGSVTAGTGFIAPTGGINATGNSLFSSGTFAVNSGANEIDISNDAADTTINLGTGAGAKTVTVGSTTDGSATAIQSGTGGINITTNGPGGGPLNITAQNGGTLTINSGTGALNIATDPTTNTVSVGRYGITAVTLGSLFGASSTTLQSGGTLSISSNASGVANGPFTMNSGTGAINISTDAADNTVRLANTSASTNAKQLTIGSTFDGSSTTFQAGSVGITIDTNSGGPITMNSGTGAINISADPGNNTVRLANIGASPNPKQLTVGSSFGASSTTIQAGSGGVSASSALGGPLTMNSGTGAINISTDAANNTLRLGFAGSGLKTVTLGSSFGASSTTIQSGTGGMTISGNTLTMNSGTGAINISTDATNNAARIGLATGVKTVTVGSTFGASSTTIQCGSGGVAIGVAPVGFLTINSGTGTIDIATDAINNGVTICSGGNPKNLTIGSTIDGSSTTIQAGSGGVTALSSSAPITINSGTGTINISTDAANTIVTIPSSTGTKTATFGSDFGASSTTIQSGTGGISIAASLGGPLTINSGTGLMNFSTDPTNTTIGLGTGGAAKTVTVGSTFGASSTTIQSGTGGIIIRPLAGNPLTINSGTGALNINTDAISSTTNLGTPPSTSAKRVTLGSTFGASSTTIQSGTSGISIAASLGGPLTINSGTGLMNFSTLANNTTLNIGTGAGRKTVTIGSTNTTSSLALNFGGAAGSQLSNYLARTTYTPVLAFGGSSAGINYSTQNGYYYIIGSIVMFSASIQLTSKGTSSTGDATVSLPPYNAVSGSVYFIVRLGVQNTTFSGGYAIGSIAPGAQVVNLQKCTSNALATNLMDTDFAANSILNITGFYLI